MGHEGVLDPQTLDYDRGPEIRFGWTRAATVYEQCIRALEDPYSPYLPDKLAAFLAELLSRVSVSYFGREGQFLQDARDNMAGGDSLANLYFDERFQRLPIYRESPVPAGRRRPTPFEAIAETARRLRDMNRLVELLGPLTMGGVLGGSMSYGRFFNVVGQREGKASDLDFYIILEDGEHLDDSLSALQRLPGIGPVSLELASTRYSEYLKYVDADGAGVPCGFTFKIPLHECSDDELLEGVAVSTEYAVSMHVLPKSMSDLVLLVGAPEISTEWLGDGLTVLDFRESEP